MRTKGDSETTKQPQTQAERIVARVAGLKGGIHRHIEVGQRIFQADGDALLGFDLMFWGALQRSIALTHGFCAMVDQRNVLCAAPIIRLQVDTVLRLSAAFLVDDTNALLAHMLEDKPLSKFKDRKGQQLTDKYLYEQASKHFPWVPEVYRTASGFIHLSGNHIFATKHKANEAARTVTFSMSPSGPTWTDEMVEDAVIAFTEATKALLAVCYAWAEQKAASGKRRRAEAPEKNAGEGASLTRNKMD
jgi:hypothetical protein